MNGLKLALSACALLATSAAFAAPTTSAPTPPALKASKVVSIYSDAYTSSGFSFGEWGSGTTYTAETIGTDNVAKFVTANNGYFGWEFGNVNCASMDKMHVDFYCEADAKIRVVPITGGTEVGQFVTLKAGEWVSADLETSEFTSGGANMANVYQIKYDNCSNQTVWIDNVYFYSTSTDSDTEAPTDLTATLVKTSYASAQLSCQATDNSGAVTFVVKDEANGINVSKGGSSATATTIDITGLKPGTTYNFVVSAKDADDNVCANTVSVEATTVAYPASAPAPTQPADNVISIFSDNYTAATTFEFGSWGQTTSGTRVNIADGNEALLLENFNYVGLDVFSNKLDVSDMEYLHVDVYSPNATKFQITPIWGSEKLVDCTPVKQGEWNSYDIPLSDFTSDAMTSVFQIKMVAEPSSSTTAFVDNIYFYKTKSTADDTTAPVWSEDPTTGTVASTSADIKVKATDETSANVTYEVSATEDFATVVASKKAASGEEATISLTGLTAATEYTFYVRVKDASDNVSEVKTVTFTTVDAAAEVTYYGTAGGGDSANWIDKKDDYMPTITYTMTTTADNQLVFNIKLSEMGTGVTAELWCDQLAAPGFVSMTQVEGTTDQFTATIFDAGEKSRGDQINFRFRFPMAGGAPMTQNIYRKVGDSNEKPADDTTAPEWNDDVTVSEVTYSTATFTVKATDDSGSAIVAISGDNDFTTTSKTIVADGTEQTIQVTGLKASTTYNFTFKLSDASGNKNATEKTLTVTTPAATEQVLYTRINFTESDWTKNGENNTFAPAGDILLTFNADNTITVKVTVKEGADLIDNSQFIWHGVETTFFTQEGNTFTCTTTAALSSRDAAQPFHMNFVLKDGKGNSEFKVTYFTPSEGSLSSVATVNAEAVKVIAANGTIRTAGGEAFEVYTLAGQKVYSGNAEAQLPRGVYIVRAGKTATKVML